MFGDAVRAHRRRVGVTQEELADRSGLSLRSISKIEGGRIIRPRPATVRLLASAFGLTGADLDAFRRAAAGEDPEPSTRPGPVPRQLPAPAPAFTGRTLEFAVLDWVSDGSDVAIAAIDGMPGVGKTALAVHWAHRAVDRYPDGQVFVDLRGSATDPAPVDPAEALDRMLLGIGVPSGRIPATLDDRAGLWRSETAGKRMLILLDDVTSPGQVQPLVPGAQGSMVLVTSRRRLTGMDSTRTVSLDVLPVADAVALLARTAARDGLVNRPGDASVEIVELCGRLPLAIRVAGARLRAHPSWELTDLAGRLRDQPERLAALTDGTRSVAAALELSYRQLSAGPRRLYRLLGLHPGPDADPYTAAALADLTVAQAERNLEELHTAHLTQEPAALRYAFHNLVRAHAAGAAARDETVLARRAAISRLLDHLLRTASVAADTAYPKRRPSRFRTPATGTPAPDLVDRDRAVAWLDVETPNLLAAAEHAARHGWPEHALHLSTLLPAHLHTRGRYGDLESLRRAALGAAQASGDRASESDALNGLGWAHWLQGRYEQALVQFTPALRIARTAGHRDGETEALVGLGWGLQRRARYEPAAAHFTQALQNARTMGNRKRELEALNGLGWTHWMQGLYRHAHAVFTAALQVARAAGDRDAEIDALLAVGNAQRMLGWYTDALDNFGRVLAYARAAGHRYAKMHALLGLGNVSRMLGRYPAALDHFAQACEIARATGQHNGELDALTGLGHVQRRRRQYEQAASHYREALDLAAQPGNNQWQFEAHQGLGRLTYAIGEPSAALGHHREALTLATGLRRPVDRARAYDGLAHAHQALGQPAQAHRQWRHALDLLTNVEAEHTADEEATAQTIRDRLAGPPLTEHS